MTNPLLNPQVLSQFAQQAAQSAPPLMRPTSPDASPVPSIAAPPPMSAGQPPTLPSPIAPQVTKAPSQTDIDKTELARKVNTGSGISQIAGKVEGAMPNHPFIGKLLGGLSQGLATLGDVGLRAVAPAVDLALPGTSLHHLSDLRQGNAQVAHDEAAQTAEAGQAKDQAQTAGLVGENANQPQKAADEHALSVATAANLASEAKDRDAAAANPALAVAYSHAVNKAINEGRDPSKDPIVSQLSDAMTSIQPGQNKTPKITYQTVDGPDGKPHVMAMDEAGNQVKDEGVHYERPMSVNVNAGDAALDRETKQYGTSYSKANDAGNAQLEKIADARSMINGNAESQALGLPKVLTALVSGAGSGVRITQAELNMIGKARGISGDVEGTINKWAGQGSLSKAQQQQLTQILDDVKTRIMQKQAIANSALDTINGASSRGQIIQADKEARQKLNDYEQHGHYVGQSVTLKNGGTHVVTAVHPDGSFD